MTPSLFQDYFPNIDAAREQIRELYCRDDDRAFFVGFSGGKDSSLLLQLIFEVAKENYNGRKIYVCYNDTLLDEEKTIAIIDASEERIERTGKDINASFVRLIPPVRERFWSYVVGRGYPAPSYYLRWCSFHLKNNVYSSFISRSIKGKTGGVRFDGRRKAESGARLRILTKIGAPKEYIVRGKRAPVCEYSPLADVSNEECFQYLERVGNFAFGGTFDEMNEQYQGNASRRVGCWCCTVCSKKCDVGDSPLMDFRRWFRAFSLVPSNRGLCSRESQKKAKEESGLAYGRFTLKARKEILAKLLETQEIVKRELVSPQELETIQTLWKETDWIKWQ